MLLAPKAAGVHLTTQQIILFGIGYFIEFCVVTYFTRATTRRVIGALIGSVPAMFFGLGAIALCEKLGWWRVPIAPGQYPLYICLSITLAPIYLVNWRVVRRFGWRGFAVFISIVTIIGPPRDYLIATWFPKWMVFSPGVAPILADGATYFAMVALGHFVMRLVAGPARADRLARQSEND